ncbi:MAG: hypothetical protein LUG93_04660 [Lachnospiraceae bacterium]|nr:hypothetical protein [Lachnospiraceae bacterium]
MIAAKQKADAAKLRAKEAEEKNAVLLHKMQEHTREVANLRKQMKLA